MSKNTAILMCGLLILSLLAGCSQYFHQPLRKSYARLGAETSEYATLKALPAPKEKIVAAVYKFRDQTGQYKPSEVGASWSTAVTQGATSILLRAMETSGWFVPIEREGLSNLFNERKIIKSSRATYSNGSRDNNKSLLPPLLFAGIILEGGIISFDSNVLTGGAGARYFGTGGSTQYREDRVTIYLRAVSTNNGRILKTVYTSKTILSQKVDVGVFRFVSLQRLLEAETGFTYNEPSEMAVKEAIEKAVSSLVIEGVMEGLWQVNDEKDKEAPIIKTYVAEKKENQNTDIHGTRYRSRRGSFGVAVGGGALLYAGDFSDATPFPSGHLGIEYAANRSLSLSLRAGYGQVGTEKAYRGTVSNAEILTNYRFFTQTRFTPLLIGGGGAILELKNNIDRETSNTLYPYITGGVGVEQLINDRVGIITAVNYYQTFTDELDGITQGKYNDSFWGARIGLSFYFD